MLEHPGRKLMTCRYPNVKELARKDLFGKMMQFAELLYPESFDIVPPTFSFPSKSELARFDAYAKKYKKATFIAKPQVGSQGDSIQLFK